MATTICANGSSARKEINGTIGPRTTTIAGLKCPPSGPKSRKIVGRTMSLDPGHLFNFQLKRANTKRSWDASILTPTHSRLNRLALSSLTSRQGIPTDNCFRLASSQKKKKRGKKDRPTLGWPVGLGIVRPLLKCPGQSNEVFLPRCIWRLERFPENATCQ